MLIGISILTAAGGAWGYLKFRRWQNEGRQMYLSFCDALEGGNDGR